MRNLYEAPARAPYLSHLPFYKKMIAAFAVGLFVCAGLSAGARAQPAASDAVAAPGIASPVAPAAQIAAPSMGVAPAVTAPSTPATSMAAAGDLPADMSIMGMFSAAHPIVKAVMGLLALVSVLTWTICLFKSIELAAARSTASADLRTIAAAATLQQSSATLGKGAIAQLVKAAQQEIYASETLPSEGIKERVALALQRVEATAARRIGLGTGILASIGSTGPFVGLFGTVWGIMNSFIGIANSHTTNLAVVAPGIAEALLATAMGLVAAIPAVVIYNVFSRSIAGYRQLLANGSCDIMRHVSRELDRAERNGYARLAAE